MYPENPYGQSPEQPYQPYQPTQQEQHPMPHQSQPAAHTAHHEAHEHHAPAPQPAPGVQPTPVVKVLSPFGVEYVFQTIALFTAAVALIIVLLALVNGEGSFGVLSFPTAMLVTAVPIFAFLFLRLKKMELHNPALKLDASKRRATQFTQIVAFLACLFTLIGFLTAVFSSFSGAEISVGKAALSALCILTVAGGVLAYYWREEHSVKR